MQATHDVAAPLPAAARTRIESIDLLRGIVIVIMALDHVRDYFNNSAYLFDATDLTKTNAPLFLTRLVTHFCAPVFTFLAGVSAYISGTRKTKKQLSAFLITRGLWLVLLEVLVITPGWTFNWPSVIIIMQVIWSIGIGMVALGLLIYLPRQAIIGIGVLLVAGHNLLDGVHVPGNNIAAFVWASLHEQGYFTFTPFPVLMGYPVLPWVGIIALGYGAGSLYAPGYDGAQRRRVLMWLGAGALVLFVVIRATNIYGDKKLWGVQSNLLFSIFSFVNTTKYPPSLLYILMTLGPALLFLSFAEKPLNAVTKKLVVFGRVPMFFYIIHIYVIHLLAIAGAVTDGFPWHAMVLNNWVTNNAQLKGYGFGLPVVYAIWAVVVCGLYPLCAWYNRYKQANQAKKWWLSYL